MTEEQLRLLKNFETRVRQAILLCESLKKENEALKETLADKEEAYVKLREEYRDIIQKYDKLRTAKLISFKDDEVRSAKKQLSKLVREIDACIALVNE